MSEKTATGPKKRDQNRAKNQPKFTLHGRPGKRTPQLEKALLDAVGLGAPYRIACMACGISDDTFIEWRRKDPVFRQKVEQAAGKTALAIMKRIREHGEENFAALSWLLERRFPAEYGRPEAQFNLAIQQNNTTNNTLVIMAEVADVIERRRKDVESKVEKLFANRRLKGAPGNGNGASQKDAAAVEIEAVAESVLPPITLPPGGTAPSASWWAALTKGDNSREIEKEAAEYVLRRIALELRGRDYVKCTPLNFEGAPVLLRDLHAILDRRLGEAGWSALVAKGNG